MENNFEPVSSTEYAELRARYGHIKQSIEIIDGNHYSCFWYKNAPGLKALCEFKNSYMKLCENSNDTSYISKEIIKQKKESTNSESINIFF